MAKKTLSMSLVVAMLATSNVPVWAAEFSDDFDAAVATEAPVTEFSDNTIETPAIEEETTEAPMAQAVVESDDLSVDVSVSESAEFTGVVSVSGTIMQVIWINGVLTNRQLLIMMLLLKMV